MLALTELQARKLMEGAREFVAEFIKRTDGTLRVMKCERDKEFAANHTGGDRAYEPDEKNLVWVWDLEKKDYRSVPLESLQRLILCEVVFTIKHLKSRKGTFRDPWQKAVE